MIQAIQRSIATLFLSFLFSLPATAATFSDLFVFGDSLSDTQARITNGAMWPEYLTSDLGLPYDPDHNFAVSGATTDDMLTSQFSAWQSSYSVDPDALYVVWGGANDLFGWYQGGADPNAITGVINNAVSNLVTITSTLQSLGANHVLLLNLPDLGMTPRLNGDPFTSSAATAVSTSFNTTLAGALLQAGQPAELIDIFGWMQAVKTDPTLFGLTNITDSCIADNADPGCPGYLFYDDIHPTTAGHELVAQVIEGTVVPVPAAIWLFASGLGLLGIHIRRQAA